MVPSRVNKRNGIVILYIVIVLQYLLTMSQICQPRANLIADSELSQVAQTIASRQNKRRGIILISRRAVAGIRMTTRICKDPRHIPMVAWLVRCPHRLECTLQAMPLNMDLPSLGLKLPNSKVTRPRPDLESGSPRWRMKHCCHKIPDPFQLIQGPNRRGFISAATGRAFSFRPLST